MNFRINLPLMVLAVGDNHPFATTVPIGELIEVVGPAEDDRFVLVRVEGRQFHVFVSDLAERAKPIETGSKPRADGAAG